MTVDTEQELTSRLSVYVRDDGTGVGSADQSRNTSTMEDSISHVGEEIRINPDNDMDDNMADDEDDMDLVFGDGVDLDDEETRQQDGYADEVSGDNDEMEDATERPGRPLGPPQDSSVKPKKRIPPQVHFARVENQLDKITMNITMEKVLASSLMKRQDKSGGDTNAMSESAEVSSTSDILQENTSLSAALRNNRKHPLDEFDKRLGMRVRAGNPIAEITSSFLGPLMRVFRIICITIRIGFNIGAWKDPFLSFWALCILVLLMLFLLIFPWRIFFFLVGIVGFGPQNLLLRKQILRLEARLLKKKKKPTANDSSDKLGDADGTQQPEHKHRVGDQQQHQYPNTPDGGASLGAKSMDTDDGDIGSIHSNDELQQHGSSKRGPRKLIQRIKKHRKQFRERRNNNAGNNHGHPNGGGTTNAHPTIHRKPFSAAAPTGIGRLTNPRTPREVVVPYTPFRLDRFYDWPPDPTVSRATPVVFENCVFEATPFGEDVIQGRNVGGGDDTDPSAKSKTV